MRKKIFKDRLYWQSVAQGIMDKRSEAEKEIESKFFITLSREDQKRSIILRDRELKEFAAKMGFEIGSYVCDSSNHIWEVTWVSTYSGMLDVDDITITLQDETGDWVNLCSRRVNYNGLKERNYFDNYIPLGDKANTA